MYTNVRPARPDLRSTQRNGSLLGYPTEGSGTVMASRRGPTGRWAEATRRLGAGLWEATWGEACAAQVLPTFLTSMSLNVTPPRVAEAVAGQRFVKQMLVLASLNFHLTARA
eukprot:scaffold54750_cov59-Phaeocystis_antarctica.AAC.3